MKRYNTNGGNRFARFGLRPHIVRAGTTYRGGMRK